MAVLMIASVEGRLSAVLALLLLVSPALAQVQDAQHRTAASPTPIQAQGVRVHRLPGSVSLKFDKTLPCATSKTLKVVVGAPSSDKLDHLTTGELMLIQTAAITGRPLVVANPSCDNEGAIVGTVISLEPTLSKPADLCALPYAKERAPECR
jgi:hypothetical protein